MSARHIFLVIIQLILLCQYNDKRIDFLLFSGASCMTRIAYLTSLLEITLQDSVQQVGNSIFQQNVCLIAFF